VPNSIGKVINIHKKARNFFARDGPGAFGQPDIKSSHNWRECQKEGRNPMGVLPEKGKKS